jgi:hypothetical protein
MLFNNQLIGNLDSNAKLSEPIGAYRSGFIAGAFTTQQVLFSDYPLSAIRKYPHFNNSIDIPLLFIEKD